MLPIEDISPPIKGKYSIIYNMGEGIKHKPMTIKINPSTLKINVVFEFCCC